MSTKQTLSTPLSSPKANALIEEEKERNFKNLISPYLQCSDIPSDTFFKRRNAKTQQERKNFLNRSPQKHFACKHCPMKFHSSSNRKDHEIRHENLRNYKCTQCSKKYYRRYLLIDHMQTIHRWSSLEAKIFLSKFQQSTERKARHQQYKLQEVFKVTKCKLENQEPSDLKVQIYFRHSDNMMTSKERMPQMVPQKFQNNLEFSQIPESVEDIGSDEENSDSQNEIIDDRTTSFFGNTYQNAAIDQDNQTMEQEDYQDLSFDHFFKTLYTFI